MLSSNFVSFKSLAGIPATTQFEATSLVTTALGATNTLSPIVISQNAFTPEPNAI